MYTFIFYLLATSSIITDYLNINDYFAFVVIVFVLLLSPINVVTTLLKNAISRKHEYQADLISVEYNLGNAMISALKKVGRSNLADLSPHPLFVFMKYSHPPLSRRIESLSIGIKSPIKK